MTDPKSEIVGLAERNARVTYAMLRVADGSEVGAEFVNGKSVDDAIASLRLAATGDTRTLSISDQDVEKVARAMFESGVYSSIRWETATEELKDAFRKPARAAILSIREGVE